MIQVTVFDNGEVTAFECERPTLKAGVDTMVDKGYPWALDYRVKTHLTEECQRLELTAYATVWFGNVNVLSSAGLAG